VVFIGIDMDQSKIVSELDHCLLIEEEIKQDWEVFSDLFPQAVAELADAFLEGVINFIQLYC
jgi:hypothetical protein